MRCGASELEHRAALARQRPPLLRGEGSSRARASAKLGRVKRLMSLVVGGLSSLVALAACSSDHSALAVDGDGGAASTSTSASASISGAGGAGGGDTSSTGAGAGGQGGGEARPTTVTLVNGVSDYDAVRLCFIPAGGDEDAVDPWPGAAGQPFARAAVLPPEALSPAGDDVRIAVIAGQLSLTSGLSCAAVRALAQGDERVRFSDLPVLPGSAFSSGKSLLIVPTGCMGGAGHEGPGEQLGCGVAYAPGAPTVDLVALGMRRDASPGKVSFLAVHASPAIPTVDLLMASGTSGASPSALAYSLSYGAMGTQTFAASLLSLKPLDSVPIQMFTSGAGAPAVTLAKQVFALSNVVAADLHDGEGYALIALGAAPAAPEGFYEPLSYALVRTSP